MSLFFRFALIVSMQAAACGWIVFCHWAFEAQMKGPMSWDAVPIFLTVLVPFAALMVGSTVIGHNAK